MNFAGTHVLLVDYQTNRLAQLDEAFKGENAIVHTTSSRVDAMGMLWELIRARIKPRAVISSWLLDDPQGRAFYSAIGREVDHTSLSLWRNVAKLDSSETIMLCYSDSHIREAAAELSNEGLDRHVVLSDISRRPVSDVVRLLFSDERTRIIRRLQVETDRIVERSAEESSGHHTAISTNALSALVPNRRLSR